ncbi:MAG: ATP-binding protein [Microcoleus sp.]
MTDYYGNHFSSIASRSNFAEAQTSQDAAEITDPQRGVCDGERQYDRLLDAIPDIVWTANTGGSATYFSQRWEDYTGIPVAAALDFGYLAQVHPDDRDRLRARSQLIVSQQPSYEIEFRLLARSGIYRWNLARASRVNTDSEGVLEWVGTYTDIDGFKQTQDRLEAETDLLHGLARSSAREKAESLRAARTVKEAQQQHLQAVERLTNLLNPRGKNFSELLSALADATIEMIAGAQFCLVALTECDRSRLKFSAVRGLENFGAGKRLYVQDKLLSEAFVTGSSQLSRPYSDGEVPAVACAVAIESPQTGRLGVLAIGNWQDSKAIDAETLPLLAVIGRQAAIAIDNVRAIETVKKQEQLLDLQKDLLLRQQEELQNQRCRLQQQNLQLLEAAQLKSQFLGTISHELRTPMNAIIGFSELLLRQHQQLLTTQQKDLVGRIFQNGKNLLLLINDILDFSKIESGCTELEIEEFDLAHLVIDVALEFGNQVTEKNLAMSVSVHLQHQFIVNDKSRLRQILVNLISNAVKFTHEGSICIEVRELRSDRLTITVQDTGIGISETDLPHIFDKFRQADQTTSRKYPGTGLGLAISESLVKMMDCTISAESQLEKGSTFRLELPRQIPQIIA